MGIESSGVLQMDELTRSAAISTSRREIARMMAPTDAGTKKKRQDQYKDQDGSSQLEDVAMERAIFKN